MADAEAIHRVQNGSKSWEWQKNQREDEGKVVQEGVRPAQLYVEETWALKNARENKLEISEMQMLRWACTHIKPDRIRSETMRGTTKVGEISKVQEGMTRCHRHTRRRIMQERW